MSDPAGHDDLTPCTALPPVRHQADAAATPCTAMPPARPNPTSGSSPVHTSSAPAMCLATSTPAGSNASLVCGILSLVLWGMPVVGLTLGIIAIVLGARACAAQYRDPARYLPSGAATAGLACGIIGTVLSTLTTALFAFILFMISLIASLAGMAGGAHVPPPSGGPVL